MGQSVTELVSSSSRSAHGRRSGHPGVGATLDVRLLRRILASDGRRVNRHSAVLGRRRPRPRAISTRQTGHVERRAVGR
ncbi:hypothetical protein Ae406Ps2_4265c [Pseudonocardia sp. Ae406_Ps2]|nr:hypothetical protein Ae331Ps2_1693 [Pseudonocardia sp. Ae331_Ps2]OLM04265.1 hypothetical protein Ae406Ps2_4265c [Pseudonocardia sp. Ae406_Ps2]OLM10900.1 hypothetical protein Ae505Ps2_1023 [Pseudonocardia sp. Ae505_Ps2]OLM25826.1 hypothetical protein Ae706Ps2_4259c [Pseudonocardia sp. Ae706_Ps2]